jgi:hypothetical protein
VRDQLHQQVDALDEGRAPLATARAADDGLSRLCAALAYFSNGTWSGGSAPSRRA